MSFFIDPLPRQNLKTFKDAVKTKKIKVNGKEHILKADRKLFGRLTVIAQSRALNMREVLKYPLGPLLWSLACSDGALAKTNKEEKMKGKLIVMISFLQKNGEMNIAQGSCMTNHCSYPMGRNVTEYVIQLLAKTNKASEST